MDLSHMTTAERNKLYGPTVTVRVTPRVAALLEQVRKTSGVSRTRIVMEALAQYLAPVAGKRDALHLEGYVESGRRRMNTKPTTQ